MFMDGVTSEVLIRSILSLLNTNTEVICQGNNVLERCLHYFICEYCNSNANKQQINFAGDQGNTSLSSENYFRSYHSEAVNRKM